jgi:Predicted AAA-ATPase/PD-(D/E)XK nuclease superfamily
LDNGKIPINPPKILKMKTLPIGIQTFSEIHRLNCLYVDKTELIYRVITGAKINFLSRPRRFGKSMTISTIKSIYEGQKELFKGLWIEDKWDWSKQHPVIHIPFSSIGYIESGLPKAIASMLKSIAEKHKITLESEHYDALFKELIEKLAASKGRVVILIDEYDKPIIDFLGKDELPIAIQNRAILRNFYSIIKDADPYIEFFFMTGVSKFSQTGIFSHLNHLKDLTLDREYVNLVGYTPTELTTCFSEWIDYAYQKFTDDFTRDEFVAYIRKWYNGYSWDGVNTVYNPYSILNFLQQRSFEGHWFRTGTPTFLLKMIREQQSFLFNNLKVSNELIDSYDLENLNLRTILFQTGYLTIKHIDRLNGIYTLDYPNREVEQAMSSYILAELLHADKTSTAIPVFNIKEAFLNNDVEKVIKIINSILKDVPSMLIKGKKEHFYHALVHLHFRYLGLLMDSEVNTSDGRMDTVVKTNTHIYILEFKLNLSADIALQQIKDKDYAAKYVVENKEIQLIGISFNSRKKAIGSWIMEKYQ